MLLGEDAHAKEEEDDAVAGRRDCLHSILHRCEALLADVLESVMLGCHSKADDADDPRPDQNKHFLKWKTRSIFWQVDFRALQLQNGI